MEEIAKHAQNLTQDRGKKFSIGLAFLFCLSFALPAAANAASLYFSPSSGSFTVEKIFNVSIYVSSADQAMNAASGVISFPQDKLEVTSLSKTGSIFNLWIQEPLFFNGAGTINFEGIVLNPGFTGSAGKIITINFRAKSTGSAYLSFSSGSVLANDGRGTNILTSMGSANYSLQITEVAPPTEEETTPPATIGVPLAPIVSSPTHPDPEKWYSNNEPEFQWQLPEDVIKIGHAIDKKPLTNPKFIADALIDKVSFTDLEDGTWYFHINFKNQYGWGKITHRKVLIDTEPPEPFEIEVDNGGDSTNPTPILYFKTADSISGIEYYEVKIDEENAFQVTTASEKNNPYKMPLQVPGKHQVVIKAIDKARNSRSVSTEVIIEALEPPEITKYPKELREGDILTVEGTIIYPNSIIIVYVQKDEGKFITGEVKADEKGIWSYTYEGCIKKGAYKIWAKVRDSRGALSESSKEVTTLVTLPVLLKFGKIVLDYLTIMITLIILIIGAIAVIFYTWYRISLWRRRLRAETKEVAQAVYRAFRDLREEVQKQIKYLDGKPGLTEGEKEVRDKLKETLDVSEKFISKEIKDVEKELG